MSTTNTAEKIDTNMQKIENSEIQNVEKPDVDTSNVSNKKMDKELDDAVDEIKAELGTDSNSDKAKPKVTLRFKNANFVHQWDLNSTNTKCFCEKLLTEPSLKNLTDRKVYSDYTVSRCGCAYHSECINKYVKDVANGNPEMANCPLCQTKYEPLNDSAQNDGIYTSA
jgi:hypothetical protein